MSLSLSLSLLCFPEQDLCAFCILAGALQLQVVPTTNRSIASTLTQ